MNVVIIGAGGQGKVVGEALLASETDRVVGYMDDRYKSLTKKDGIIFAPITSAPMIKDILGPVKFMIAIGDNRTRWMMAKRLALPDDAYLTYIHPSAIVSPSATFGPGSVVMARTVIQADAVIGRHTIINTGSVIEHDNCLGDFVHISPGAILTGGVTIDAGAHIGAGAAVIPNVKIGEWSVVGAGTVVLDDLPPRCTAVGNPARVLQTKIIEGV